MSLSEKINSMHTYDGEDFREENDYGDFPHIMIEDVREAVRELARKLSSKLDIEEYNTLVVPILNEIFGKDLI